ncbi:hypothetical protein [Methanospirillum hungatei]|nr:hypothetical protein [Methanospirillum hungatei]
MSKFTLLISKGAERDLAQLPKFARRSLEVAFAELEFVDAR